MFKCHCSIICKLKFTVYCCLCYYMYTNRQCNHVYFVPTHFLAWEEPYLVRINATIGQCGWTVETSIFSMPSLLLLLAAIAPWMLPQHPGAFWTSSFLLLCSLWLVSPPLCPGDERTNEEPHSESRWSFTTPSSSTTPQSVSQSLTHPQSVLHICLDVRRGGHFCLYERTVDVSSVVYCTPYKPWCWLTVVCYLQDMPDRMLCAVLEQFQLYFSLWYVRFVSIEGVISSCVLSVKTACTLLCFVHFCIHKHANTQKWAWAGNFNCHCT